MTGKHSTIRWLFACRPDTVVASRKSPKQILIVDDGGAIRVQPILQQPRPLHGRQAPCQPVAATPVRTLQYA